MNFSVKIHEMQYTRSPHLSTVLSSGKLLRYNKGETVTSTNDPNVVHMVMKGFIKRYNISNDGSLGVQIIYGPQDIFSLTKTFRVLKNFEIYEGPENYYYTAMCDAQVYAYDLTTLMQRVKTEPVLYEELFCEAGHHLKSCVNTLENISLRNSYARVAHELLFFAREFGVKTEKGMQITIPLTHQDIADVLGTTRETVTMAIVKLRAKNIIDNLRQITVLDIDKLAAEAYS